MKKILSLIFLIDTYFWHVAFASNPLMMQSPQTLTHGKECQTITDVDFMDVGFDGQVLAYGNVTFKDGTLLTEADLKFDATPTYCMQGKPTLKGSTIKAWMSNLNASLTSIFVEDRYTLLTVNGEQACYQTPLFISHHSKRMHPTAKYEATNLGLTAAEITCTLLPTDYTYTFQLPYAVLKTTEVDGKGIFIYKKGGQFYERVCYQKMLRPFVKDVDGLDKDMALNVHFECGDPLTALMVLTCDVASKPETVSDGLYHITASKQIDSNTLHVDSAHNVTLVRALELMVSLDHIHFKKFYVYEDTHMNVPMSMAPEIFGKAALEAGLYRLQGDMWHFVDRYEAFQVRFHPGIIHVPPDNSHQAKTCYETLLDLQHNVAIPLEKRKYRISKESFKSPDKGTIPQLSTQRFRLNAHAISLYQLPHFFDISDTLQRLDLYDINISDEFADQIISAPNLRDMSIRDNCTIDLGQLRRIIQKPGLKSLNLSSSKTHLTSEMWDILMPLLKRKDPLDFHPVGSFHYFSVLIQRHEQDIMKDYALKNGFLYDGDTAEDYYSKAKKNASKAKVSQKWESVAWDLLLALVLADAKHKPKYAVELATIYAELNLDDVAFSLYDFA